MSKPYLKAAMDAAAAQDDLFTAMRMAYTNLRGIPNEPWKFGEVLKHRDTEYHRSLHGWACPCRVMVVAATESMVQTLTLRTNDDMPGSGWVIKSDALPMLDAWELVD